MAIVVIPSRILVTGSTGFIGSALATHLHKTGFQVQGTVRSLEKEKDLPPGVESVLIPDIGPETDWKPALSRVDTIIHLAARVHRQEGRGGSRDSDFFRINTEGTAQLAKSAAEGSVKRLIFISTVKVNGEGSDQPYTESDAEDPKNAYAESKLGAELALAEISSQSDLETVILRLPLVYGPGVKANFMRLIRLVGKQAPMPFAGVSNRRSLLFIDNLLEAILLCMQHPMAAGQTYLVADEGYVSTPQLIRQIAEQTGVPSRLFPCPAIVLRIAAALTGRTKEMQRLISSLYLDTRKIQDQLQWHPSYNLEAGLAATLADYQIKSV